MAENPPEPAQVIPESLADLLERPLYAHLATVRPDGTPQVNPTWFRFDGTYLWLTTTTSRQKNRNWQIQPAVAVSITDPGLPCTATWRSAAGSSGSFPIPGQRSSSGWPSATAWHRGRRRMPRTALP